MNLDVISLKMQMRVCGIPEHMRDGLAMYIADHRPVGQFLTAVLKCDFVEMCSRADGDNQRALYQYFFFLHNYAPSSCWRSAENVQAWVTPPEAPK